MVDQSLPSCGGCGKLITDKVHALGCDRCLNGNAWMCTQCLNMTDEMYEALSTPAGTCLKWFCNGCNARLEQNEDTTEDKSDKILRLLEQLVKRSDTFDNRLTNCEHTISKKADSQQINELQMKVDRIDSIETRLHKLEEMMTSGSTVISEQGPEPSNARHRALHRTVSWSFRTEIVGSQIWFCSIYLKRSVQMSRTGSCLTLQRLSSC